MAVSSKTVQRRSSRSLQNTSNVSSYPRMGVKIRKLNKKVEKCRHAVMPSRTVTPLGQSRADPLTPAPPSVNISNNLEGIL